MKDISYEFSLVEWYRISANNARDIDFHQWLASHGGRYIPTEIGKHATIRFDQDEDAVVFKLKFGL